jgi:hypothetical protein
MKAKIVKIVGWTLGMTVGVYLIPDGKVIRDSTRQLVRPFGSILGVFFARKLGTNVRPRSNC